MAGGRSRRSHRRRRSRSRPRCARRTARRLGEFFSLSAVSTSGQAHPCAAVRVSAGTSATPSLATARTSSHRTPDRAADTRVTHEAVRALPAATSTRRTRAIAGRWRRRAHARCWRRSARLRRRAARQHRVAEIRRCAHRHLRRAAPFSGGVRRAGRYAARRLDAATGERRRRADYIPVIGAVLHGSRPPKLPPLRSAKAFALQR